MSSINQSKDCVCEKTFQGNCICQGVCICHSLTEYWEERLHRVVWMMVRGESTVSKQDKFYALKKFISELLATAKAEGAKEIRKEMSFIGTIFGTPLYLVSRERNVLMRVHKFLSKHLNLAFKTDEELDAEITNSLKDHE